MRHSQTGSVVGPPISSGCLRLCQPVVHGRQVEHLIVTWLGSILLLRYFRQHAAYGGVLLAVPFIWSPPASFSSAWPNG